nr:MAG TPA: hypothetical protein [Caudoviricetes sp.]
MHSASVIKIIGTLTFFSKNGNVYSFVSIEVSR